MQFCPVPRVYLGASRRHVVFVGFRFVYTETYLIIVLIFNETDAKFWGEFPSRILSMALLPHLS